MTHVTSTLGDVPFTLSDLKSEFRSFTLHHSDNEATTPQREKRAETRGQSLMISPVDTAKHSR